MKKLGLVGGVGYLATLEYYKSINEEFKERLVNPPKSGANPPMVIDSLNIETAYNFVAAGDWTSFTTLFLDAINRLALVGAEFGAIGANTAHIVFDELAKSSPIPLIGIVDETCKEALRLGLKKLIIFGTDFTMKSGMYEKKCEEYGLVGIVPNEEDRQIIHNIIFPNLEAGIVIPEEKAQLLAIVNKIAKTTGADGLVLGCTELPFAIKADDTELAVLDTGAIHVRAILDMILSD